MPKRFGIGLLAGACLFASACTDRSFDLLDAAKVYEQYEESFGRAISQLSDGASESDVQSELRQQFPVRQVTVANGQDGEIDQVAFALKFYGLSASGRAVGLIYMPVYERDYLGVWTEEVFENCTQDALDALHDPDRELSAVYCRINEHWLAFQYSN